MNSGILDKNNQPQLFFCRCQSNYSCWERKKKWFCALWTMVKYKQEIGHVLKMVIELEGAFNVEIHHVFLISHWMMLQSKWSLIISWVNLWFNSFYFMIQFTGFKIWISKWLMWLLGTKRVFQSQTGAFCCFHQPFSIIPVIWAKFLSQESDFFNITILAFHAFIYFISFYFTFMLIDHLIKPSKMHFFWFVSSL